MAISFSPVAKIAADAEKARVSKTPLLDKLGIWRATPSPRPLYIYSRGSGGTYQVLKVDKEFTMTLVACMAISTRKPFKFDCRYRKQVEEQYEATWDLPPGLLPARSTPPVAAPASPPASEPDAPPADPPPDY